MSNLIQHHIKYKELHGVDETVWLTRSEHRKLHNRLRREGKCNIPSDKLGKISTAAHHRTEKAKENKKEYDKNPKIVEYQKEYHKKNTREFKFYETLLPNVRHRELIRYNMKTGNVIVSCGFMATRGKKLFYIVEGINQ